jgi:hypothetical protein
MDRIVKGTHLNRLIACISHKNTQGVTTDINLAGWCGNFSEVLNPAIKLHKTSILLMLN